VLDNWERNKLKEKGLQNQSQVLTDVPRSLPALHRSFKVQQKAAQVGFDWDTLEGPRAKILEELGEVEAIVAETRTQVAAGLLSAEAAGRAVAEEVGDLLFATVNFARHLKVQPEIALTGTTDKFIRRFTQMEILAAEDGVELDELSLEELDELWDAAKLLERETNADLAVQAGPAQREED
jgi:tetrapyrrole methylase family protein/MazG family protein